VRRGELERGIALDVAKHDIAERISQVCKHFSRDDFEALVERMAEIEVRYRLRDDWLTYRDVPRQPAFIH